MKEYHKLAVKNIYKNLTFNVQGVRSWRMNLTAVSLSQQKFFVAVDTVIHVYRLLEEESLIEVGLDSSLREPTKKLQRIHDNPENHIINAIKVGMLGFQEVLVCVDDVGEVCIWYTANLDRTPIRFMNEESTWGIALNGPKRLLAVSSNAHKITIFDLRNGLKDSSDPNDMDLSEGENYHGRPFLTSPTSSSSILDENGVLYYSLVGHTHNVPDISFSPCGQYLVSCSIDCSCRVWNVQTGEEIVGKDISRLWGWSTRFVSSSSFELVPEDSISTNRKSKNRCYYQNNESASDINIMSAIITSHTPTRGRIRNFDSEYEDGYFLPTAVESFESSERGSNQESESENENEGYENESNATEAPDPEMYDVHEFAPSIDYEQENGYDSDSRTIPMTDDEWASSSENRNGNHNENQVENHEDNQQGEQHEQSERNERNAESTIFRQISHWIPREVWYGDTSPSYPPRTPQYFNFTYSNNNSEHQSIPPPPTPRPASASSGYIVPSYGQLSQPPSNSRITLFTPESPIYFPTSPAYVLSSPTYSPTSPQYSETSPVYSPTSPNYMNDGNESPIYANYGNTSPISNYSDSTLNFDDTSPHHETTFPNREIAPTNTNCPVTPDYGAVTPDYGAATPDYGNATPNASSSYGATSFSPIREETSPTIHEDNVGDSGSPNNEFGMQPPSPLYSPSTPFSIPASPAYRETHESSTIDDTSESRFNDTPISLDDDNDDSSSSSQGEEQSPLQSRESPIINLYDSYVSPSRSTSSGESSGRRSYERQSNYSPTYIRLVRRNLSLFTDLNDSISTDESVFTRISDKSSRTKKKSILKITTQQSSQNAVHELILFSTQTDLYLLDPKSDLCVLDWKKNIVSRNDVRRGMNIAEFDRLNMIEYVPELSLAIVASQKGRVALVRILRFYNLKGEINYSLYPEIYLPPFPLPPAPLLGMFIVKNEKLPKDPSLFYCCLYLMYLNGEFYCYDIRKSDENFTLGVPEKIWL